MTRDALEAGMWGVLLSYAEEYASLVYGRDGRRVTVKETVEHLIPLFPEENPHRVRGELALQYKGDERFTMEYSDQIEGLIHLTADMIRDGNEAMLDENKDDTTAAALESLKNLAKDRITDDDTVPVQQGFLYKGGSTAPPTVCPRCMGDITIESAFYEYHSTDRLSRYLVPNEEGEPVRAIKICVLCEEDEAWVQFHKQGDVIPPHQWPVERKYCTEASQERELYAQEDLDEFRHTGEGQTILQRWEIDDESYAKKRAEGET